MASRKSLRRALVSLLVAGVLMAILLGGLGWKSPPSIKSEPALAQELSPPAQAGSEGIALLVLIDESGGMNGLCGDPQQVFVVDREGRRYQTARFLYNLFFSYWAMLPANDRPPKPLLGFIQYARQVSSVTDIPPESPPGYINPCYTYYVDAIKAATAQLENMRQQGAQDLHLILITDGSFRGARGPESDRGTEAEHQNAQNRLKETLASSLRDIKLHVLILGRNQCYERNDCGLNQTDHALRQDDIEWWRDTAPQIKPGQIAILDESQPFDEIAQIFWDWIPKTSFGARNLGNRWGRWDMNQGKELKIPPAAEWAKIVLVSPHSLHVADIQLYDEEGRDLGPPNSLQIHPQLPAQGLYWVINNLEPRWQLCTPRRWTLQLSCRGQSADLCESFFYWWVDYPDPWIADVEVPPSIDPHLDPQFPISYSLPVALTLEVPPPVEKSTCHRLVLEAYRVNPPGQSGDRKADLLLQQIYPKLQSGNFSFTLPITPYSCASHPISVVARIESIDEFGNPELRHEETRLVNIVYQPEILWDQIRCEYSRIPEGSAGPGCSGRSSPTLSVDPSSPITVEIPVRYATENCNPGVQIRFRPLCSRPSCGGDGCLTPAQIEGWDPSEPNIQSKYIQNLRVITQGDTVFYQFVLKPGASSSSPGLWECGYQTISVTQISESGEERHLGNVDLTKKCLPGTSYLDVTPVLILVLVGSRSLFTRLRKPNLSAD